MLMLHVRHIKDLETSRKLAKNGQIINAEVFGRIYSIDGDKIVLCDLDHPEKKITLKDFGNSIKDSESIEKWQIVRVNAQWEDVSLTATRVREVTGSGSLLDQQTLKLLTPRIERMLAAYSLTMDEID